MGICATGKATVTGAMGIAKYFKHLEHNGNSMKYAS